MSVSDFASKPDTAADASPIPRATRIPSKQAIKARLEIWIAFLNRDPSAEERAAEERRSLLLKELNQTVADAPDDVPIKYVIDRLNRHWDD